MEYKFRVLDKEENKFWYFTLQEILERRMCYRGSWDEMILRCEKSQYTGINDCKRTEEYPNGQEIYVGDILQCVSEDYDYDYTTKVYYYNNIPFVEVFGQEFDSTAIGFATDLWDDEECTYKIIGNIYQTKED